AVIAHQLDARFVTLDRGNVRGNSVPLGQHYHWLALHPAGTWMAAMTMGSNAVHMRKLPQNAWTVAISNSVPPLSAICTNIILGSEYFAFSPDGKWFVSCWSGRFHFYRVG